MTEDIATYKASRAFRLNGWQRIGVVLSVLWGLAVVVAIVLNQKEANIFSVLNEKDCDYSVEPFFDWYDAKSGQPISEIATARTKPMPADPSTNLPAGFTSCEDIQKTVSDGMLHDTIAPVTHLRMKRAAIAIFLPILLAWVLTYILVYTIKWVARGFRKTA